MLLIVDSQAELRYELVRLLEQAGHRAAAVMTVSEASSLVQAEVPELLATDAVLADGSSTNLVQQAAAAGAKTLMMTGSPIASSSLTAPDNRTYQSRFRRTCS